INVGFPTLLTRALLPVMQEPALVLNLGSYISRMPGPLLTVYTGSKAFNMAWSRSLGVELRAEGRQVEVMGLLVGEVQSAGYPVPMGPIVCSPRTLARSALDRVGCGRHIITPWWRHAIVLAPLQCLPDMLMDKLTWRSNTTRMEEEKRRMKEEKINV
ncbi:hypothetical protein B0H19DRAFT_1167152, partial [Mycena capillaripes]